MDPAYGVEPRPPVIVYPVARHARAASALGADLGPLLGPSRAALLSSLRAPATTSELAAAHFLSPATVSYHLGILLRSGLVSRERRGREVRYRRTGQGSRLVSGGR
ncbi:ArsR/SmtB family transcription factor [Streptacidiphilus monticola]